MCDNTLMSEQPVPFRPEEGPQHPMVQVLFDNVLPVLCRQSWEAKNALYPQKPDDLDVRDLFYGTISSSDLLNNPDVVIDSLAKSLDAFVAKDTKSPLTRAYTLISFYQCVAKELLKTQNIQQ